jgi:glutamate racemase
MSDSRAPIGVFDSGVGGLSVLKEIRALLPHENLVYVADSLHAPWGDKPVERIRAWALAIARRLVELGAKAIVIASNTGTAASAESVRAALTVPVIAMEPAVKPAAAATRTGVVGVLVTVATSESDRFQSLLERYGSTATVVTQPAPGLVERVEAGDLTGPETRALVERYMTRFIEAGADTIVLGSTHYPFLRPVIAEVVGADVTLIDTGAAVARQVARVLESLALLNPGPQPGRVRFWTTGDLQVAERVIPALWGQPTSVEAVPDPIDGSDPLGLFAFGPGEGAAAKDPDHDPGGDDERDHDRGQLDRT